MGNPDAILICGARVDQAATDCVRDQTALDTNIVANGFLSFPLQLFTHIRCSGVVTAADDCVKIEKRNIMKNHMLAFLLCRSSDPPSVGARRVTFRVRRSAVPLFLFLAALCPRYYLQAALCSCMSVGYQIRSRVGCREVAWHDAQRSWGMYKTIVRSISSPHLCKEKSMILLESARRWFETTSFTRKCHSKLLNKPSIVLKDTGYWHVVMCFLLFRVLDIDHVIFCACLECRSAAEFTRGAQPCGRMLIVKR